MQANSGMLISHAAINGATSPSLNTKLFENQVPKLSLAAHHLSQSQTFTTPNNGSSAANSYRIDTAENQDNKSLNDGDHRQEESGALKLR